MGGCAAESEDIKQQKALLKFNNGLPGGGHIAGDEQNKKTACRGLYLWGRFFIARRRECAKSPLPVLPLKGKS
jgi:hypothetical protein